MNENKRNIATDLKKFDAHVVRPEEYDEAPEWTDEQIAAADLHEGGKLIRRGRPPSPHRKVPVKLRLDPEVVARLRASGPGWQTRVNATLRAMVLTKEGVLTIKGVKLLKRHRATIKGGNLRLRRRAGAPKAKRASRQRARP